MDVVEVVELDPGVEAVVLVVVVELDPGVEAEVPAVDVELEPVVVTAVVSVLGVPPFDVAVCWPPLY